jgi:ribosome recycling factor
MHALTFTPAVPRAFRARLQRRERCSTPRAQRGFVVRADGEDIDPEEVMMDTEDRMEKSIESIRANFNTVRTGRANAAILDRVEVEYYGAMTPLRTIAQATTPDSQTILISPFDKGAINDIERALMMSDLGLTPGNDGNCIRLNIPPLTADRRKELAKLVSKLGEDGKVAIRNVRRDALKSIGKLEGIGEDDIKGFEDQVEKMTEKFVKQVDELVKTKEAELAKV